MSGRRFMPARRQSVTMPVMWHDGAATHHFTMTVGFYRDGTPGEVFASGPREGSTMLCVLSDGCILISKLRQAGVTFADLAAALDKAGEPGRFNSPLAALVSAAADLEREVLSDAR